MAERATAEQALERGESFELANEFAAVTLTKVRTRNGVRLEIHSPRAGALIRLDPLELEALALQDPELFTRLVGDRGDEVSA
jgi:hypothetical protein